VRDSATNPFGDLVEHVNVVASAIHQLALAPAATAAERQQGLEPSIIERTANPQERPAQESQGSRPQAASPSSRAAGYP
jgi:hypothetical protein